MKNSKKCYRIIKILKNIFAFFLFLFFVGLAIYLIKFSGIIDKINSIDKIKKIVENGGVFSFLVFIIFQILQTTVLQIPSFIVTIAGTLIFGRFRAFVLSFIAIMIGSCLMFFLGRKAGRKFLRWLIGNKTEIWIKRLSQGKYLFFLMMLFPFFPDDILCAVAGVTDMSFQFFFITNIISRGIGIAGTVFLASGEIIPFHSWGLIVWALIFIFVGLLFFFSVKFQDKIDKFIAKFLNRKNN